jgi:hypothetical protein
MRQKPLMKDRRFIVSVLAVTLLFVLGLRGINSSESIALVAISLAGANAASEAAKAFARKTPKKKDPPNE